MAVRAVLFEKPEIPSLYDEWVKSVAARLDDRATSRNELVSGLLSELYGGARAGSLLGRVKEAQFDPRNITLEAEYYGEMDASRFYAVKPLLWLWQMFDRSPIGHNVDLGLRFRSMLAKRVFRRCGKGVRIFHDVEVSFGYNITCGDNVSIHRGVLLDDRGEIVIGDGASISDFANIYSHNHDPLDIMKVTLHKTVIGESARLTYHSTVLAGAVIGADAMVGAHGVATKDIEAHHIAVGIPAKSVRIKHRE